MDYRLPEEGDAAALRAYMQEHFDCGEASVSESFGLESSDYPSWLARMRGNASVGDGAWGRSLLYLCFDGERLVGLLSVRYELSEELARMYGHIGYGVRPSERRKGYATAMLRRGLAVCREKGLREAIVGCYRDNLASAAVIRKSGGVLFAENDGFTKGRTSLYYSIEL